MLRRSYLLLFALTFLLAGTAAAQNVATSGKVLTEEAKTPIAGATVDFYPVDGGSSKFSVTTDAKGEFVVAATRPGTNYIIVVSAPNFSPTYLPRVPAGSQQIALFMSPGDGRTVTEADVREAIKQFAANGGAPTAEQRAQAEKEKAKIAEIEAKNNKAKNDAANAQRILNEGSKALDAKDFAGAIAKFDEGIAAVPDFVGITPRFYINRGVTYHQRAAATNNRVATTKDMPVAEKVAEYGKVESDFADAAASYLKAWEMVKDPAAAGPYAKTAEGFRNEVISQSFITFRAATQTKRVTEKLLAPAKAILSAYIEKESDNVKKAEGWNIMGDFLRAGGEYDASVAEYKKALEVAPDNPETLFGISMALILGGTSSDDKGQEIQDKAKYQEAANYLARFETLAKGNPKYAEITAEVPGLLEVLKAADVAPQKGAAKAPARKKT